MSRITAIGKDYIVLRNEADIKIEREKIEGKVHLIELDFKEPTEDLMNEIISEFPKTRRFVVSKFIRFYNNWFKEFKDKKYYVQNQKGNNLFIFLKRNNKVLLNFLNMREVEKELLLEDLRSILEYVEVVRLEEEDYTIHERTFKRWNGNVIIG